MLYEASKVSFGARRRRHLLSQLTSAIHLFPHRSRGWERAPMKQRDARVLILQEWDQWIQRQTIEPGGPTGKDSLKFFHELEDTKSPLLSFQSRGQDKWRIIHGWLLDAQRLYDQWVSPAPRIVPTLRPRPVRTKSGSNS
jgi:hypothetical protein